MALQTTGGLSGYPTALSTFGTQDFIGSDMSLSSITWGGHQIPTSLAHSSGLPHLSVSSSTPPPASSPLPVKIKSEPISPPRDHHTHLNSGIHHSQVHSLNLTHGSHHPRPNSAGQLTPTPGSVTPTNLPSPPGSVAGDYDGGPMLKRPRLSDGWPS